MLAGLLQAVVVAVALEHLWFMALETFLWTRPIGLRTFGNTPERARLSAALAANQGVYNGFLAAGLAWSLFHPDPEAGRQIAIFFLGCVAVAGIAGAVTVSKRIFFVQALPALLGLVLAFLAA